MTGAILLFYIYVNYFHSRVEPYLNIVKNIFSLILVATEKYFCLILLITFRLRSNDTTVGNFNYYLSVKENQIFIN